MPKDKVEAAIKRASGQDAADYEEILYEGYAPHGVAVIVETATDNPTRTVANVRSHFKKGGGNLGTTGSVALPVQAHGRLPARPRRASTPDALELDLIDHGLEEMGESTGEKGEPQLVIRCAFADFGQLQKALEDRGITPLSAESEYVRADPGRAARGAGHRGARSWSTRSSRTTTSRRCSTTSRDGSGADRQPPTACLTRWLRMSFSIAGIRS